MQHPEHSLLPKAPENSQTNGRSVDSPGNKRSFDAIKRHPDQQTSSKHTPPLQRENTRARENQESQTSGLDQNIANRFAKLINSSDDLSKQTKQLETDNTHELTEIEPISQIDLLKKEMRHIFREEGDIQLIAEEKYTFQVMDMINKNPPLQQNFLNMMEAIADFTRGHDDPNHRVRSQAAFAFMYANVYRDLIDAEKLNPYFFYPDKAMFVMDMVKPHLEAIPDRATEILFTRPLKRIGPETNIKDIDTGTSAPRKIWEDDTNAPTRAWIQEALMDTIHLQEEPPACWNAQDNCHHRKYSYDISSLNLTYHGHALLSFEHIHYPLEEAKKYPDLDLNQNAGKFTTQDGKTLYVSDHREKPTSGFGDTFQESIRPFLSGKHIELDTKAERGKAQLPDSYWQNKYMDWHVIPANREIYHEKVHPLTTLYIRSIAKKLQEDGKTAIDIIDVAGGNGDLAERTLKDLRKHFPTLKINYKLIDYSEKDVNTGNERFGIFSSDKNITVSSVRRNVIEDYDFDAEKVKQDQDIGMADGAHIVINSGGLLNFLVSPENPDTPTKTNKMLANLIKPGGFGVYTGESSLLINKKNHTDNGLDVLNLYDVEAQIQVHVVHKKTTAKNRNTDKWSFISLNDLRHRLLKV